MLEAEDSGPSQVAQACMILANGATLNDEQKRSVLTVIQRRLEQLAKDKEALIATTTVPESFSDFAAPVIASNSRLPVSQIMITTPSSMTRSIPVTTTSLVVQLLNVVFTIDDGKTTEPQRQLLFEATRGVFDIVMSARPKAMDEPESAVSRGFRIPPNAIPGLLWPDLELTDGAGPFGPRYPELAQRVTKELWRDHAPTKSDWMHFIILTHPIKEECGSYLAFAPSMLPAARTWQRMMGELKNHFGDDASLDAATAEKITRYLVANAGDAGGQRYSSKLLRGVAAGASPQRITELPKWVSEHRKVPDWEWRHNGVRTKANCVACHTVAEQGYYDD